jgi:membrane peptidoglycan carboxypeptidase
MTTRAELRAQAEAANSRRRRSRGSGGHADPSRGASGPGIPSRGAGPRRPRRHWGRIILFTLLGLAVFGLASVGIAYAMTDVPQPNDAALAQASVIYYADGKTEMGRISEVNRESVKLDEVPDQVQKTLLAAEDRTFYENNGVSPTGIARAVWVGLRGGQQQGGSTITQQYVKNYFLTQDRTYARKVREILISMKVDRQLSKDQILENYMNTIYFGRGAYGIETASKAYFGKDVGQLTLSQAALLASVINAPSLFDPAISDENRVRAEKRWNYVLDGMVQKGWATAEERTAAKFPKTIAVKQRGVAGPTGYIIQAVKNELVGKLELTQADIDRGGLQIVTTINKKSQDAAVKAVNDRMPTGQGTKNLHAGLVAIKPGDGAVVAMYGGKDYQKVQFNTATDARLQAGSTFKVFTLIATLQDGESTKTRYSGKSPQYFPEFEDNRAGASQDERRGKVSNFGNEQFGEIDVRNATAHSVNTIFAQMNIKVGAQATVDAATAAGLPEKTAGLDANLSNVFGTASPHVIDMANAYATIAARGARVTPYLVKSVSSRDGDFNYKVRVVKKAAFDKGVMADTADALQQVVQKGTGAYARSLDRPAAGKTGTTTDNYAAWFDGFTPQLATAVGIYKGDGSQQEKNRMDNIPGVGELTGGTVPVRIWTDFMEAALRGMPVAEFPPREGIGDEQVPPPTTTSEAPTTTTTSQPTRSFPTKTRGKPHTTTTTFSSSSSSPTASTPCLPPGHCP